MQVIERTVLGQLFDALKHEGYTVIGPTVRDQAIVCDEISSAGDLPQGWTDAQEPGKYRVKKRDDQALFGYVVGPISWKKFLYPPRTKLWEAQRSKKGFQVIKPQEDVSKFAFLGVRSCELHAIAIQDKVFLGGAHVDPLYKRRREQALMIAVNCGHPAGTCFCTSMKTGPKATAGFDLALTEILENGRHYFTAESGSPKGEEILKKITSKAADPAQIDAGRRVTENAVAKITRRMETQNIKELLYANAEHPRWDDVAERCLSCANCTMVCPTCFCSTTEEVTDLTGDHAERWRVWDSCFTLDFSKIHGGSIRPSTKGRYRQWMTHKLASWHDQFGTSGCVGCGRCLTWCPVGIDITEEVRAIREHPVGAPMK